MPPSLSLSPVSPPHMTYLLSNLYRQSKERFLPFSNLRKSSFPYDCSPTIYFYFHFAEIENLSSGTVQEISIVLNDIYSIAPSIILQYLVPRTITTSAGIPVNLNEENYLRISAALDSKLPPIINGFEVFYLANSAQVQKVWEVKVSSISKGA
ncbi:putative leucine-rich repeat receptor-like serine/threonine-protein kinase [Cucumis melo var. makuwa]|uniref:Leucine-rich repeat receptor-like serine/threonine-protein kinase n=1 Tax=Cucumis melo var. makuwa TaxID=1194695 RepID=A0A5A7T7F6_CUCMM|nr:putative leucine-rich repeat receptor-like serine/threonine-protein kinase [Cucumis melo var. makuwa]TYK01963.1 putative leucine-rich repeat receptor-like serine/threonine-protein kinase [Cucumis melo var. makuwa]